MERKITTLLLLVFYAAASAVLADDAEDSNNYVDSVIKDYLGVSLKSLDPTSLPDFDTSFRTRFDVIANFSRGALSGLASVKRSSDCGSPYTEESNTTLNCSLTFDQLNARYDLNGKYGSMHDVHNALAHGVIKGTDIFIEVTTATSKNIPFLKTFLLRYLGNFEPSFDHLGFLYFPRHTLGRVFAGNCSLKIVPLVNDKVRQNLADSVSKLTMPT